MVQVVIEETGTIPRDMEPGEIPRFYPELRSKTIHGISSTEEIRDMMDVDDAESKRLLEGYIEMREEKERQEKELREQKAQNPQVKIRYMPPEQLVDLSRRLGELQRKGT